MPDQRHAMARLLVDELKAQDKRLVLAESCTGGLIAATLASIPGVSNWFCGSQVTYRTASKIDWIAVDQELIEEHTDVSGPVTDEMARRVLANTPEAGLAMAVTGHLGPGVPADRDGIFFVSVARREAQIDLTDGDGAGLRLIESQEHRLVTSSRLERQTEATELALTAMLNRLRSSPS